MKVDLERARRENCPDYCRDLEKDLEICEAATPGPVKWQKFGGEYFLAGQYGMRPIILGIVSSEYGDGCGCIGISNRDQEKDLLIPLDPNHPDSKFIEEAWQGWPVAIRRAIKAEKQLQQYKDGTHPNLVMLEEKIHDQYKNGIEFTDENGNFHKIVYNEGDTEAGIMPGWELSEDDIICDENERLKEENARLREYIDKMAGDSE